MNKQTKANFQCNNAVGTPKAITSHILKSQSWVALTYTQNITFIKTEEHKDWNKYNVPKNSVQFLPLLKSHRVTKPLRLKLDPDLYSILLRNVNKLELRADSHFARKKTVPNSTCKSFGMSREKTS